MLLSALSILRSSIVVCFLSTAISSCMCMLEVGLPFRHKLAGFAECGKPGSWYAGWRELHDWGFLVFDLGISMLLARSAG